MAKRAPFLLACIIVWCLIFQASSTEGIPFFGPLIPKESRRTLIATESGVITAVNVFDGLKEAYQLQFFTLEPSSLFLPVLLHTDMVFYVQTGRGTVSWATDDSKDGTTNLDVERGDVYRLEEGSIFYIRSHPDPAREKLRIHAIFNNFNFEDPQETSFGAYSSVSDLVRGFDDRVLQMSFKASEEVVQDIKWAIKPPPIVHFAPNKTEKPNWTEVFETLMGGRNPISLINGKKKKKSKTNTFNVFKETPDVKNCNGWSVAVTNRDLSALKHSNIGVFMVNLTKGSMMGPHWNPMATEIATVIEGEGMVQIVCASNPSGSQPGLKCQNMRFKVREGDVFIVPRFHPMAQMSFNNESLVFMGFSTSIKSNRPQYLAGKWSVLRTIDRDILAVSMGASNATIEKILASQDEGVMLECTSCAEEVEKTMEEEIARRREEEEAARRKKEVEEARRREEEEARKREEEEKKREEEEAKRREEEEKKKEEEEEAKKREEEEKKKREEEETRKREEEEAKRKEEEEARKRQEEEEEEARKREEEAQRREEEEKKKREEEEAKRKREEEEEARKREEEEEEEEARKREEEEEAKRKREEEEESRKREEEEEEEVRKREEEESRKREEEEEARRKEEEARKEKEKEARKREEEESRKREEEEEEIRRQEQKEIKRQEEEAKERARKEEEKEARKREEEEARKREEEEEEIQRQEQKEIKRQEEEAKEREEGGGNRKIEEASEKKKGSSETSGGERVMWRKIWMA